jgi:hypothetical protein
VRVNARTLPATSVENSQYALRLLGSLGPVDASLIWYDGINSVPAARREADGSVTPVFNPIKVLGANVAFNTGKIGWRSEVGYLISDGRRADASVQYVIGADRTFANLVGEHDLYVLVQYVGLEVTRQARLPSSAGLSQAFANTAIGLWRYEFSDFTRLELRATVNLDKLDHLLELQWSHKFTDALEGVIGVQVFGGGRQTFFGQFDGNDRLVLRLTYTR